MQIGRNFFHHAAQEMHLVQQDKQNIPAPPVLAMTRQRCPAFLAMKQERRLRAAANNPFHASAAARAERLPFLSLSHSLTPPSVWTMTPCRRCASLAHG